MAVVALSLPSPRAFFAFLFTERLFSTISEPDRAIYIGYTAFGPGHYDGTAVNEANIGKIFGL